MIRWLVIDRVGNGRFDNWIIIFSGVLEFKVVDVTICSMWLESKDLGRYNFICRDLLCRG